MTTFGAQVGPAVTELIAATAAAMTTSEVVDNVLTMNPATELFKDSAKSYTGYALQANILGGTKSSTWATNDSVDYTSAVDGEIVGRVSYDWSKALITPTRLRYVDLAKNSGKEQIVDLAKTHLNAAYESTAAAINTQLHASSTGSTGLETFATIIKATGTVGSIDQSTSTWWKSTVKTYTTGQADIRKAFQSTINAILVAGGKAPTHILAGLNIFEAAQTYVASKGQVQITGSNGAADLLFQTVVVDGVEVRLDSGLADDVAYLIHKPSLVCGYLDGNFAKVLEPKIVPGTADYDILTTSILAFGTTSRRDHARLNWVV